MCLTPIVKGLGQLRAQSYDANFIASVVLSYRPLQEKICAVDEWEIPIGNIIFRELIRKGGFGRVYSGKLSKVNIEQGQSNLKSKNLSDSGGQERKFHSGNESPDTIAVKTINSMRTLLFITCF